MAEPTDPFTGHTKGPWLWEGDRLVSPGYTRKGDGTPKRLKSRDAPVIAVEPNGGCSDPECCDQGEHLEVSPVNRELIAAAPDLLAQRDALRGALRAVTDAAYHFQHCPQCAQTSAEDCFKGRAAVEAIEQAEAALAQTEGGKTDG